MGCPIHIWVPVMAAMAPAATIARHRLNALIPRRREPENPAHRIEEMRRWSPVSEPSSTSNSD